MWALNILLYLLFVFAPDQYDAWKAAGVPCYGWVGDSQPDQPSPVCFYDPEAE